MKRLCACATLLIALLAAGCGAAPKAPVAPAAPDIPVSVTVGDTPRHIDPGTCDPAARRVIDQERLTQVSRCTSEAIKLADGTQATYVLISYGPGMDCPAGCIYERKAAVVLPDRIGILPEPFPTDRDIHHQITQQLKVSMPDDIHTYTDRHLEEKEGKWYLILAFNHYLLGTVVVSPTLRTDTGIEVHATPAGALRVEQVQDDVWPQFLVQCQPPAGAHALGQPGLSPRADGGLSGTLVWGVGEQSSKIGFSVSPSAQVRYDQGCGQENLK